MVCRSNSDENERIKGEMIMRSFLFLVLCTVSLALFADARIETADDFCHAPYDGANADNENYLANCGGVLYVHAGGTRAHGQSKVAKDSVSYGLLPVSYEEMPDSGIFNFRLDGDELLTPCTMVDSNGTNYVTDNWAVRINVTRSTNIWRAGVVYIVECWGGVAQ